MIWIQWLFPFLFLKCWGCTERVVRWKANVFYLKHAQGIDKHKICKPCANVLEAAKLSQKMSEREAQRAAKAAEKDPGPVDPLPNNF